MAQKIILALLLVSSVAFAGEPLPRKILALYDAREYSDHFFTPLHQQAEMPLNYLGMELVFRDVNQPLPSTAEMANFRGVITWFEKRQAVQRPADYCSWILSEMDRGKKLVILGRLGFATMERDRIDPVCQKALEKLGVRYLGNRSESRFFLKITKKDHDMVEFEHDLGANDDLNYAQFKIVDPRAHVYLQANRIDMSDSESALVITSPNGGLVYDSYVLIEDRDLHKLHWRINPYRFFEEAFGVTGWPRPDPTTMNGSRIFYSHIDGDGIFNVSHIDQHSYSAEIILEDVLKKNLDVPVSASIIAGYLDLPQYAGEREMSLYRNLFSLSNVEPGVHGYAHPLIWKKQTVALKIPGYQYSVDMEVKGAVEKTRNLLSKLHIPKDVTLYQWTGNCLLPPEALASAEAAHVENMNGGDTRFDRQFDSYAFVYPLSIVKGGRRQVYISASNENTYTNLWEGPYYGYADVLQTFDNTESPRRIKPVNIYYHYYSGERQAALQAVKKAYDYAHTHSLLAMWASDWPPIVNDFFATKVTPIAGGYQIHNLGKLRTIRFDHERRNVDMLHSKGVVGFAHERGSLYVSLDEGVDHSIILTSAHQDRPYIINATFKTRAFQWEPGGIRFEKLGWMTSHMRLGGMHPNATYTILAGTAPFSEKADRNGELEIHFSKAEMGRQYQEVIVRLSQ
ncbi:MAG: hypothetical protein COV45_02355 [Deltaproteobacteria bacterium CG11_big_fil_rev_8_21_14_0_20_47_16]|nr:MAG: hypothetical protein COV45_02355 [Deltaproteobacteria bacterium CG11_big_fil_rev_8_21_14_0_20_47_16]